MGGAFGTAPPHVRARRPMTSAEVMRQQMRVTEQSDNRLRKTLMRTLVGQMGRRAETIILPLELIRQLKPAEFNDHHEYHLWQKRQLKTLEAGLVLHPSFPFDKSSKSFAMRLKEIVRACQTKPMDTNKNSESIRTLCNCVVSLSWRVPEGSTTTTDICHWADGYPINVHLYTALLRAIFDLKEETLVLDEVDELLELMKKTWLTLGINKPIHNLCFTWVLFERYVVTGQVESDLLCAAHTMLAEVASDARKGEREGVYMRMLSSVLVSMKQWSENRLLDYHGSFNKGTIGQMENLLPFVFSVSKILNEDVILSLTKIDKGKVSFDSKGNKVDQFIRMSLKSAFAKVVEDGKVNSMTIELQEVSEALIELAKDTEELASKEKEIFSPVLKKWLPFSASVAAITLHSCFGTLLKRFLAGISSLTNETIMVLQNARQLEKTLVEMVVEDSIECEDGGKSIAKEMVPYEVDSIILGLLKQWIQERLKKGKQCLQRAKETETWNPKSKTEPYAQSAAELIKHAKEAIEEFFEIPMEINDAMIHDLADGLENLFRDYTTFAASCGSKQSYIPILPPLTRSNRHSKLTKLWRKAILCRAGMDDPHRPSGKEGHHPRPSTSRGTQRLYIRLNTLHYLHSQVHSLGKTLSLSPRVSPSHSAKSKQSGNPFSYFVEQRDKAHSPAEFQSKHTDKHLPYFDHARKSKQTGNPFSYFDQARQGVEAASLHVSEVASYRLVFLDSNTIFYGSLYSGDVENARINPTLRILKQNLTLLSAIVTDQALQLAVKEVMKASFEAYLMVLLAGGSSRIFSRTDHEMIEEDLRSLKRVFGTCGEGVIAEEVVEREAETVEGVVALMGQATEQLVEDFSVVVCESSGILGIGVGHKLPMPPTTGKWNRGDPNTILRVLCHRDDRAANHFLKRTFQIAKRLY